MFLAFPQKTAPYNDEFWEACVYSIFHIEQLGGKWNGNGIVQGGTYTVFHR
jgi:hypothetical protein